MSSIRKRNGKFQARIHRSGIGFISKTFLTRPDAVAWARQAELDVERLALGPRCPTFGELVDRYASEVTPRKKSARTEQYILKAWRESRFGQRPADGVAAAQFAKWRDERLSAGVAGSTVRNHLNTLSSVFRHAATEWGYPQLSNPLANLRRPMPGKARTRRVTDEELKAISKSTQSRDLGLLIRLAVETGMRLSELINLRWQHINLVNRTAYLPETKNGHSRTVPLSSIAAQVLGDIKSDVIQRLDGRLFFLTPHAASVAFRRACQRVEKQSAGQYGANLRFHDLRHEAVSRFFERGLNAIEVASISGHRSMQMLARYAHLNAESLATKLG
jgi:integrase